MYCQQPINTYNYNIDDVKLFLSVSNVVNKNTMLIFGEKSKTDFVLFDENFNEKFKISIQNEKKATIKMRGYSIIGNKYYVYSEKNDQEIIVNELDFDLNKFETSTIAFKLDRDERIVSRFSKQNSHYIVSSIKDTNVLYLYIFTGNKVIKNTINCAQLDLYNANSEVVNVWDLFSEKNGTVYKDGFNVFSNPFETDIIKSTQKKKIFFTSNQIILSLDLNANFSQYLFIDLDNYTISQKKFQKQITAVGDFDHTNSNSFFVNNKIFLIKVDGSTVYFTIKDLNDTTLKKFIMSAENVGDLKNFTPYLENGFFTKKKLLSKPQKFFNQLSDYQSSLFAYFDNNKYYFTFGAVSYPQQSVASLGMFGAIGAIAGVIIDSSNSGPLANYSNKYIVYTKDVLSTDFESITENIGNSSIENLRNYLETVKTKESILNTIPIEKNLILVMYNKLDHKISFYKF